MECLLKAAIECLPADALNVQPTQTSLLYKVFSTVSEAGDMLRTRLNHRLYAKNVDKLL
jgi:hypothetical protein